MPSSRSAFAWLFQSTHLREVRFGHARVARRDNVFQSTHLREVRSWQLAQSSALTNFNPRTYVRCDSVTLLLRR